MYTVVFWLPGNPVDKVQKYGKLVSQLTRQAKGNEYMSILSDSETVHP